MPKPNQNSTVAELKAYIRSKKLNHPLVKLGLKKAELQAGLKKLGHWSEAEKTKKTRKRLSKGQKEFLGGIDDKPKKKAEPKKKESVTYKGKKFEVAPAKKKVEPKKKTPAPDKDLFQKVSGIMAEVGKQNLKTGREIKEIPLTSLTLYDPFRTEHQDEYYFLKLRDKELTSGEFAKWFRGGGTIYKEARVEIKKLFQKIKDDGVKLYFAHSFYRSPWAVARKEKFVDVPKHRRDLDLQIVAIKNGKLVSPPGVREGRKPQPLHPRDFDDADEYSANWSAYFDIKFFKKGDMGYKISSGIV